MLCARAPVGWILGGTAAATFVEERRQRVAARTDAATSNDALGGGRVNPSIHVSCAYRATHRGQHGVIG